MMKDRIVVLGTAHRMREGGKCSPDKRLKECVYSREIVAGLKKRLEHAGVTVYVDMMELDIPRTMQTPSAKVERQRELALRVNYVNDMCSRYGSRNVCYVSVHVNAAGADGKWHDAKGWQVCVSPDASERSRTLARKLYEEAERRGLKVRKPKPTQVYWEQSLYVLNRTLCPAVLTENMFQDNKADVDWLLSDEGRQAVEDIHFEGIMGYLRYLEEREIIEKK